MGVAETQIDADRRARRNVWFETATVVGKLTASTPGTVVINLAGAEIEVPTLQPVTPNLLVRVARSLDGTPIVLGPAGAFPAQGTISAVSSGVSVSVLGDDGLTYGNLPYLLSYAPVVGHLVALDGIGRVIGRISTIAGVGDPSLQPPVIVPPKPPEASSGVHYFSATDSGSYQGGWWTNKVYYSENNLGAWFYGTQVRDTLAGAVAQPGCYIYLPVEHASGSNAWLGVHPHPSKPGGAPAVSGGRAVSVQVNSSAWYPLDTDIAQHLINNSGSGVSTYGAGYRIFSGRAANADSGRLAISWRRG